jgi:septation ring formation regulator EzrA
VHCRLKGKLADAERELSKAAEREKRLSVKLDDVRNKYDLAEGAATKQRDRCGRLAAPGWRWVVVDG